MDAWREQQARGGRVFGCATQAVGGYPFRIEVRCAGATAELKDAQPPIAIKLKEILAVAQVWDPKLLIAEFTGPLTVVRPGPAAACARLLVARAGERARDAGGAGARLDRGRRAEARRRDGRAMCCSIPSARSFMRACSTAPGRTIRRSILR